MFNEEQKKPFVSLSFSSRIITAALLVQANGADVNFVCCFTSSIEGRSIFVLVCFSAYFTNQNIYILCSIKNNMLLKLLKVIIEVRVALKSAFDRFAHKDAASRKIEFFAYVISPNKQSQF